MDFSDFPSPFVSSGRSPRLHLVSVQNCCNVLVGRPILARTYEPVHRRMSLMSLSLLLRPCPARLVPLIWMVLEMGGW